MLAVVGEHQVMHEVMQRSWMPGVRTRGQMVSVMGKAALRLP